MELVERRVYLIRKPKVMLDAYLAQWYGVPTMRLNRYPGGRNPGIEDSQGTPATASNRISGVRRRCSALKRLLRLGHRRRRERAFVADGVDGRNRITIAFAHLYRAVAVDGRFDGAG